MIKNICFVLLFSLYLFGKNVFCLDLIFLPEVPEHRQIGAIKAVNEKYSVYQITTVHKLSIDELYGLAYLNNFELPVDPKVNLDFGWLDEVREAHLNSNKKAAPVKQEPLFDQDWEDSTPSNINVNNSTKKRKTGSNKSSSAQKKKFLKRL